MSKPSVNANCNANQHAAPFERILEVTGQNGIGCLVSIRNMTDGTVQIDVYRADPGVVVNGPSVG